jgi:hypothetical protein
MAVAAVTTYTSEVCDLYGGTRRPAFVVGKDFTGVAFRPLLIFLPTGFLRNLDGSVLPVGQVFWRNRDGRVEQTSLGDDFLLPRVHSHATQPDPPKS